MSREYRMVWKGNELVSESYEEDTSWKDEPLWVHYFVYSGVSILIYMIIVGLIGH